MGGPAGSEAPREQWVEARRLVQRTKANGSARARRLRAGAARCRDSEERDRERCREA